MSGKDYNVQSGKVNEMAKKLCNMGHDVFNPFTTPLANPLWNEKTKYAYYMGRDIEQLLLCDAVFFCDRLWPNSKGCRAENIIADIYGIKKYFKLEDIPNERVECDGD